MKLQSKEHFLESDLLRSPLLTAFKFSIFFVSIYSILIITQFSNTISFYLSITTIVLIPILYFLKKNFLLYLAILIFTVNSTYYRFSDSQINTNNQFKDIEVLLDGDVKSIISSHYNRSSIIANATVESKHFNSFNTNILLTIFRYDDLKIIEGEKFQCKAKLNTIPQKIFPNEFPTKQHLKSLKVNFTATSSSKEFIIYDDSNIFYKVLNHLRNDFKNKIFLLFPEDVADVIFAITIGDKSFISKEEKQIYSLTGTSHIMAVSGLHVGIIAVFLYFFTFFIKNEKLKYLINSLLLIGYVVLTGLQASSIRAASIAIMIYLAIVLKKHYDIKNLLGFAIVIFILIQPEIILSVSFQFSVAAFLGIVLYTKRISDYINYKVNTKSDLLSNLIILISTSISAMIFTSPLVAYYFNNFTLLGIISNMYAIPIISLSLILSFIVLFISFLSFELSFLFANSVTFLIRLLEGLNSYVVKIEYLFYSGYNSLIYAVIFSLIILVLLNYKSFIKSASYIALGLIIVFSYSYYAKENTYIKDNYYYKVKLIEKEKVVDLYIFDKSKNTSIFLDYSLLEYIEETNKNIRLTINGDNGRFFYDNIKDNVTLDSLIFDAKNIINYFK